MLDTQGLSDRCNLPRLSHFLLLCPLLSPNLWSFLLALHQLFLLLFLLLFLFQIPCFPPLTQNKVNWLEITVISQWLRQLCFMPTSFYFPPFQFPAPPPFYPLSLNLCCFCISSLVHNHPLSALPLCWTLLCNGCSLADLLLPLLLSLPPSPLSPTCTTHAVYLREVSSALGLLSKPPLPRSDSHSLRCCCGPARQQGESWLNTGTFLWNQVLLWLYQQHQTIVSNSRKILMINDKHLWPL